MLESLYSGVLILAPMAVSNPIAETSKKPWALTVSGLVVVVGLIAMPFLVGTSRSGEVSDWVRFLGHFHPVLLHLPIGVFSLILFRELGLLFAKRGEETESAALFPLFFGAVSAILAAITGFLLYHGHLEEYAENPLIERHLWGGLTFAVAVVVTFLLKSWSVSLSLRPVYYRLMLFGSLGVMGLSSHDGASITHGSNYLTIYAPEPLRGWFGVGPGGPKSAVTPALRYDEREIYADIVVPILERRCVQCHNEEKAKGKLRMDRYDLLVAGGEDGPGIVPGNSEKSHIFIRMTLPEDDEEHMPPKGKPAVQQSELEILKWWIDHGADPIKSIKDSEIPEAIKDAISRLAL